MSSQSITPELRQWIAEQSRAGCRREDVMAAMVSSGWDERVAAAALAEVAPSAAPGADRDSASGAPDFLPSVPEPDLGGLPSRVVVRGHAVDVLMSMGHPRVVVFGGLLTDAECDALVASARPRLARSETVVYATGGNEVNSARTSQGMFFGRGETELCQRIESRIEALVRWPARNGEGLQVLNYQQGAEYRPHHDYFDPQQPGMGPVLRRGGQRVATLVMYLNTPEGGGGTVFPDVGLEVAPIKGNAVFFSYDRPHPSTRTLHGGSPVLRGEKWVATKWLRERECV